MGYTLRETRRLKGMSMRELAALVDVTIPTIERWETSGKGNIPIGKCYAIADALDVNFNDIIFLPTDTTKLGNDVVNAQ